MSEIRAHDDGRTQGIASAVRKKDVEAGHQVKSRLRTILRRRRRWWQRAFATCKYCNRCVRVRMHAERFVDRSQDCRIDAGDHPGAMFASTTTDFRFNRSAMSGRRLVAMAARRRCRFSLSARAPAILAGRRSAAATRTRRNREVKNAAASVCRILSPRRRKAVGDSWKHRLPDQTHQHKATDSGSWPSVSGGWLYVEAGNHWSEFKTALRGGMS